MSPSVRTRNTGRLEFTDHTALRASARNVSVPARLVLITNAPPPPPANLIFPERPHQPRPVDDCRSCLVDAVVIDIVGHSYDFPPRVVHAFSNQFAQSDGRACPTCPV